MNRKKTVANVILFAIALVLAVAALLKTIGKINFKKNLNGCLYYSANAGQVVKYGFSGEKKEKLLDLGDYNVIGDCCFDKDNSELTALVTTKDGGKALIICTPTSGSATYKAPKTAENSAVKSGYFYYIENKDGADVLYKTDIKAQKTDQIAKWDDTVTLCQTEGGRLYFNKKSDNRFYYLENGREVQCPENVVRIIAANDKAVVSYNTGINEITVFDAYTWDVISSLRVDEDPIGTAVNQKADKIAFCFMTDRDLFDGNTDSYANYMIADLPTGKVYSYKTDSGEKIVRFFGWSDGE